jgi:hypothetical protein
MKRKILSTVMVIGIMTMFLTGCQSAESKSLFTNPKYTQVDITFDIEENQLETLCYVDDEIALFTIGTESGRQVGLVYDTDYILSYDYTNGKVVKTFQIDSDGDIFSAVPYKEGILYVDYTNQLEDTRWQIKFTDGEKTTVLAEGECDSYSQTPKMTLLENTPVYVWQDNSNNTYKYGVNKVEDMTVSNIFTDTENTLGSVYFYGNGKEYCTLIQKPDSEFGSVVVGNLEQRLFTYDLKHKLTSFGITNEKVVCALADSDRDMSIQSIDIKTQTMEESIRYKQIYALKGLNNNTILYADGTDLCQIDIDNFEKTEIPSTEEISSLTGSRVIYPISEDKCIIEIMTSGASKYYIMEQND